MTTGKTNSFDETRYSSDSAESGQARTHASSHFDAPRLELQPAIQHPPLGSPAAMALLVDDESYARRSGRSALEQLGYRVVALGGGAEALAALPSFAGRLAFVVLDLSLSGMDGAELFYRMRDFAPNLPVLLACGEATLEQLGRIEMDAFTTLLTKPYRPEDISRQLSVLPTTVRAEPLS